MNRYLITIPVSKINNNFLIKYKNNVMSHFILNHRIHFNMYFK